MCDACGASRGYPISSRSSRMMNRPHSPSGMSLNRNDRKMIGRPRWSAKRCTNSCRDCPGGPTVFSSSRTAFSQRRRSALLRRRASIDVSTPESVGDQPVRQHRGERPSSTRALRNASREPVGCCPGVTPDSVVIHRWSWRRSAATADTSSSTRAHALSLTCKAQLRTPNTPATCELSLEDSSSRPNCIHRLHRGASSLPWPRVLGDGFTEARFPRCSATHGPSSHRRRATSSAATADSASEAWPPAQARASTAR